MPDSIDRKIEAEKPADPRHLVPASGQLFFTQLPDGLRLISVVVVGIGNLAFLGGLAALLAAPFFTPVGNWWAYALLVALAALFTYGTGRFFRLLCRNRPGDNGMTLVPSWVLPFAGVLFAAGGILMFLMTGAGIFVIVSISILLSTFAVARAARKRKAEDQARAERPQ